MSSLDLTTYQLSALETMAPQDVILKRLTEAGPEVMQLYNGSVGLNDEAGEIASTIKRCIEYGGELDRDNIKEEVGDCLWRLAQIADALNLTLSQCAKANLRKLQKGRYKDGYSDEAAAEENRDRENEASLMEDGTEISEQTGQGFSELPEEQSEAERKVDCPEVTDSERRQMEFKKRMRWDGCCCTVIDYDFPNPTMRFSPSCTIHRKGSL